MPKVVNIKDKTPKYHKALKSIEYKPKLRYKVSCSYKNIANMVGKTLGEEAYDFSRIADTVHDVKVSFMYEGSRFLLNKSFVAHEIINGKVGEPGIKQLTEDRLRLMNELEEMLG